MTGAKKQDAPLQTVHTEGVYDEWMAWAKKEKCERCARETAPECFKCGMVYQAEKAKDLVRENVLLSSRLSNAIQDGHDLAAELQRYQLMLKQTQGQVGGLTSKLNRAKGKGSKG